MTSWSCQVGPVTLAWMLTKWLFLDHDKINFLKNSTLALYVDKISKIML